MAGADAAVFDEDADLYDQARPGYPAELFDDLMRLAALGRGSRVLEIGPGTGQATRDLAGHGLVVTAVERGASLVGKLRDRVPDASVDVVNASFESWPLPSTRFDAVSSFTAWHWLDLEVRAGKVHAALTPGGVLATVTTSHVRGGSDDFFEQAQGCYQAWDPSTPPGLRLPRSTDVPDAVDEIDASPLFGRAIRRRYEQELTYTSAEYLALLMTYSGHRALPHHAQTGLLGCISELIDTRHGGVVSKRYLHETRIAALAES